MGKISNLTLTVPWVGDVLETTTQHTHTVGIWLRQSEVMIQLTFRTWFAVLQISCFSVSVGEHPLLHMFLFFSVVAMC